MLRSSLALYLLAAGIVFYPRAADAQAPASPNPNLPDICVAESQRRLPGHDELDVVRHRRVGVYGLTIQRSLEVREELPDDGETRGGLVRSAGFRHRASGVLRLTAHPRGLTPDALCVESRPL